LSVQRIGRKTRLAGGISIGSEGVTAGTLTGRFLDLTDYKPVIVSNRHVLEGRPGQTAVLQPGPYDGGKDPQDRVGIVKRLNKWSEEVPFWRRLLCALFGRWLGSWCESRGVDHLDAGVAEFSPSDASRSLESGVYLDDGRILAVKYTHPGDGIRGMRVWKSGRTTGVTFGTVVADSATVKVWYGDVWRTLSDVVIVNGEARGGDSGSPVFLMRGGQPSEDDAFCGILVGGSGNSYIFCKYKYLVEELNVKWQ